MMLGRPRERERVMKHKSQREWCCFLLLGLMTFDVHFFFTSWFVKMIINVNYCPETLSNCAYAANLGCAVGSRSVYSHGALFPFVRSFVAPLALLVVVTDAFVRVILIVNPRKKKQEE